MEEAFIAAWAAARAKAETLGIRMRPVAPAGSFPAAASATASAACTAAAIWS